MGHYYRAHPEQWANDVLGITLTKHGIAELRSVLNNRRTAVFACHSSSKTLTAAVATLFFFYVMGGMVITTAPTENVVKNQLWRDINRLHARTSLPGKINQMDMALPDGRLALGFKADDKSAERFQGFHSPTGQILVIVDEATGVVSSVFEAIDALMSSAQAHLLYSGNPLSADGEFHDACTDENTPYNVIHIDAFDTPNFEGLTEDMLLRLPMEELERYVKLPFLITPMWAREVADKYGVTHPYYLARVRGIFPRTGSFGTVITEDWVDRASALDAVPVGPVVAGLDVARSLDKNETVLIVRKGMTVIGEYGWYTNDEVETMLKVEGVLGSPADVTAINVDIIGLGAGVFDMLQARGWPVVPINSALPAESQGRFGSRRDEMWWGLRELFQNGHISGTFSDELRAQLLEPHWTMTKMGKIVVEGKKELSVSKSGSPDRADAMVYCFATGLSARVGVTVGKIKRRTR